MQKHVELEVALEVVMARIAQNIFELSNAKSQDEKEKLAKDLKQIIYIQEEAYKGDRKSVNKILDNIY